MRLMALHRPACLLFTTLTLASMMAVAHEGSSPEPSAGHPEPRVIVTVTELDGPHDRAAVQRSARESWGAIVRCYKQLGGRKSGKLDVRLEISGTGKVVAARRLSSTLNDEVSGCLAQVLRDRAMPGAAASSIAMVELRLAPGDR